MDLSRILSPQDDYSLPRGIKRSRSGSPRRYSFPHSFTSPAVNLSNSSGTSGPLPLDPPTLPSQQPAFPADSTANLYSDTDYGTSSPFHFFDPSPGEDWSRFLDRVDGLSRSTGNTYVPPPPPLATSTEHLYYPQESSAIPDPYVHPYLPSTDPGAAIWRSLGQTSPSNISEHSASTSGDLARQSQNHDSDVQMGSAQSDQNSASLLTNEMDEKDSMNDALFEGAEEHQPRRLGQIDLTQEDDTATPHRRRKRRQRDPNIAHDGAPGPSNSHHATPSERSSKRPRTTRTTTTTTTHNPILIDDISPALHTNVLPNQSSAQSAASPIKDTDKSKPPSRPPTKLTGMQCTICMDSPHELTATTCGHVFCRECIQGWLGAPGVHNRVKNCPACRMGLVVEGSGNPKNRTRGGCVALEFMKRKRPAPNVRDGTAAAAA